MKSGKSIDANGFETYRDCKFFCECVTEYLGSEIDPEGRYNLNPKGIYKVYRPKSEIGKPDFIESLNSKPVLDDHCVIGNVDGLVSPDKKKPVGVLSEVKIVGNELHGRIDVWSPSMISKIHNGKVELSLSYGCDFVPRKGIFNGERYDFIQSNLRCGNHLAFVGEARNGHDCRVKDGMFARDEKIQLEKPDMDISKLSADEVVEALKGCSDEVRAKCRDFLNTPTEEEKKAAEDAARKAAEDKAKAEEEAQKAKDEAEAKKAEEDAKAKEEAEKEKEEAVKKACDSAITEYRKALSFANDCKPIFGEISTENIKTENDVIRHICDMKIDGGNVTAVKIQKIVKDSKPDSAISAIRCALAMGSVAGTPRSIVADSAVKKQSFRDYMANR